jgi:hypothetical protein
VIPQVDIGLLAGDDQKALVQADLAGPKVDPQSVSEELRHQRIERLGLGPGLNGLNLL